MIRVDGSVAIISIKNFPIGLHVVYLYFPDTPRISDMETTATRSADLHRKYFLPESLLRNGRERDPPDCAKQGDMNQCALRVCSGDTVASGLRIFDSDTTLWIRLLNINFVSLNIYGTKKLHVIWERRRRCRVRAKKEKYFVE